MTEVSEQPLRLRNIRLINEEAKDQSTLDPIVGYTQQHLPSLIEACKPLADIVHNILHYASIAIERTPEHPPDDLTHDESAAICLYTMEWDDRIPSLYSVLNHTLRTEHRDKLRPWFKYLTLFLTALVKIPCAPLQAVWRGVAQDISAQFPRGTDVTWWSFSSCTTTLTVLENSLYLGNAINRTLFSIEAFNARNVSAHSYFKTEDEILLLPGTYMEVRSQLHPTTGLHIVHLRQKIPKEVLLEPPFPDAPVYPAVESLKMPFYYQKRWYIPISSLVVAIIIAVVLGSVLGTRSFPTEDVCNITTLSTLTKKYETVYGLWNTTASGNSVFSAIGSGLGKYNSTSPPYSALDQNFETDFMSVGSCMNRTSSKSCGIGTGFFVIPIQGATLVSAIQFTTNGNTAANDPLTITIEGSNEDFTALMLGKSWSLFYSGPTGLNRDPGRSMKGEIQCIDNTVWYSSYRILVTSKRDTSDSVSYGEVTLIGHENPNVEICNTTTLTLLTETNELVYGLWNTIILGDGTLGTSGNGIGNYFDNEVPRYALDQNSTTKYTSFGECLQWRKSQNCGSNTGLYVTLQQGATLLRAVQFTTAENTSSHDPLSITIEGSNATWSALMRGASWSLIATLPTGLDIDPGRRADGLFQCLHKNTIWYTSYRILVTSVRGIADCVQFSEVKLFGHENPHKEINSCDKAALTILTSKYEVVYGLSNTTASGNSTLATPGINIGTYFSSEIPRYALDQTNSTKYTSFGNCFQNGVDENCGTDTGFYLTLQQGATLLRAIQFTTANNIPQRDPLCITIEGSNATSSALMLGASWSLIYGVSTGLEADPGRKTDGPIMCLPVNVVWYTSYRILVTAVRTSADSVQYSEVKLLGYANPDRDISTCYTTTLSLLTNANETVYGLTNTTVSGNGTLAQVGIGVGNYYFNEEPRYALDQNSNTKYTNFGDCSQGRKDQSCGTNTGFYVTPQQGATLLLAIQFTTANDPPVRDPLSVVIEGSNATSSALMLGASWSLISSTSTGLEIDPGRRNDGIVICLPKSVVWYTSYRILVTSIRDIDDAVQYSEVKLLGYENPSKVQDSPLSPF